MKLFREFRGVQLPVTFCFFFVARKMSVELSEVADFQIYELPGN